MYIVLVYYYYYNRFARRTIYIRWTSMRAPFISRSLAWCNFRNPKQHDTQCTTQNKSANWHARFELQCHKIRILTHRNMNWQYAKALQCSSCNVAILEIFSFNASSFNAVVLSCMPQLNCIIAISFASHSWSSRPQHHHHHHNTYYHPEVTPPWSNLEHTKPTSAYRRSPALGSVEI